jgi:GNAT superfamily N-acetyltransferase
MSDFQIVKTHPSLISYVDSLQKKNAESLSFYPRCVFEREAEKGRIFVGLLNGEPCGYLYVGAICNDIKCHQVCIEYDARRRLYGACLVQAMEDYATSGNAYTITLRCGFDLQANEFWKSLGYGCLRIEDGGVRRMRKINVWQKTLIDGLFTDEYIEPAKGKTSSSIWRKHKKTGIITGFARGKQLKDYRAMIISASEAE